MINGHTTGGEIWELDVKPLISSTKWLQVHGLHRNRLSMKQILSQIGFKHSEGNLLCSLSMDQNHISETEFL